MAYRVTLQQQRAVPLTSVGLGLGLGLTLITELVEPVLVLQPSLGSRVDLPGLASKQQASSTREMGKDQNSALVLWIRVKFWWMIPMGVKYNHKNFEQETQRWRPATGFAGGGPQFQKLQFKAKNNHFWAKKAPEHIQNGQTKGNGGCTSRAA